MLLIFYLNWFSFAFCAARDLYVSLEDFLRDLPTPDYNVSQLLENSTAFQDNADPQLGWTGNPPLPANEELWCKSVSKGTTLMNAMTYTDEDAGQTFSPPRDTARSDYNYGDLQPWGYCLYQDTDNEWCNWEPNGHWGHGPYLRAQGLDDRCKVNGGMWDIVEVIHGDFNKGDPDFQTYMGPDGRVRRVTASEYHIGINGIQGGVIAFARYGPEVNHNDLDPPVPPDQYPLMKSSSDMLWALWQSLVVRNDDIQEKSNIKFFMSMSIENPTTLSILKRALDEVDDDLTPAGRTFGMASDQGRAILGSPNGLAFAYMLIQHKHLFGKRLINRVHVMECLTRHKSPCLFFTVATYPNFRVPPPPSPEPEQSTTVQFGEGYEELMASNTSRNFIRAHTISGGADAMLKM